MATNVSTPQTVPPCNSTIATMNGWQLHHQNLEEHLPGVIVFTVGFCIGLAVCIFIGIRDHYLRKYGTDIVVELRRRWWSRRNSEQMDSDRVLAEELQRRLNEDEREAERVAKRKEREEWYGEYIKDFTMTVKAEDLFFAHDSSSSESTLPEPSSEEECETRTRPRFCSTSSIEDDLEGLEEDLECGISPTTPCVHDPVACNQDEEDAHLYLRLPVKGADGICRTVDAQCAICFSDYEKGDEIVWSGLQCQHAFHRDCIFPWLGKGKKRCPMCRHWFVPGTRIDDQKKALEERLRREAQNDGCSNVANDGHDETLVAAESQTHHQKPSTTEIASGDADATSTTEEATEVSPSSSMSLDSGHESDESDHNHCNSNESRPMDDKDTSMRGRCETEEVTSEIFDNTIEVV